MCDRIVDKDPLVNAVYAVLSRSDDIQRICARLARQLDAATADVVDGLIRSISSEEIFRRPHFAKIDIILSAMEQEIEAGRQQKVEHHEYGEPEIYWGYTEEASQLRVYQGDLEGFRDALERVALLRRAELLAAEFRDLDHG
ncbi:MAG: hypothetical protein ACU0GE_15450 [Pseudooceanicola nanhaiensis]|uniref:hypothetical protein n=1 Tax=Rhodobacterales TaxID=204455 RepID=UPI00405985F8